MKIKDDIIMPLEIKGIKFKNPFFVASGPTSKNVELLQKAEQYGFGAASIKLTFDPYPYINKKPRYGWNEKLGYFFFTAEKRLNFDEGLKLIDEGRKKTKDLILWANMTYSGDKGIEGWVNMAKKFEEAGAHIIELNMCCPNMSFNVQVSGVQHEGPKTGASLGQDAEAVSMIVKAVKEKVNIPIFVKLTGEGGRIGEVAKATKEAGADGVGSAANRLAIPPIDIYNPTKSVIHLQKQHTMACYGGSWLKPSGLRDVFEMRKSVGKDFIVLGVGGVETYHNVVEMIMVGADLIGICTGILIHGFECLPLIIKDLKNYMKKMKYNTLHDFRDLLLQNTTSADDLVIYKGYAKIKPQVIAPCKFTCPNSVPVQTFIKKVADKEYQEAFNQITSYPLQTICSYVCPHHCETECTRKEIDEPIAIKEIKKFVLEYGRKNKFKPEIKCEPANNNKVAIIGSGPCGLSCAFYLVKAGYSVTIFEREKILGGIPQLAIPRFRLKEEVIDQEIETLKNLGVEIKTGITFGKDVIIESLTKNFKAIFIAIGAHNNLKLGIKNENAKGNFSALDFLKAINAGKKPKIGKKVAVIGGGFSAIDSARSAIRLGAKEIFVLYRRTKDEMPSSYDEITAAEEEGIRIMYLVTPKEIITENNKVKSIKMINLTLGEQDSSGRRKPVEVKGTEFLLKVDTIITALGQKSEIDFSKFEIDEKICATNIPQVFIGGDCATGPKDVINAIASGKQAAISIDRFLTKKDKKCTYSNIMVDKEKVIQRLKDFTKTKRVESKTLLPDTRITNFDYYTLTLTAKEAEIEAKRCLNCGCDISCGLCEKICTSFAVIPTDKGFEIDKEKCEACGMCVQRCPNKNIEMINEDVLE